MPDDQLGPISRLSVPTEIHGLLNPYQGNGNGDPLALGRAIRADNPVVGGELRLSQALLAHPDILAAVTLPFIVTEPHTLDDDYTSCGPTSSRRCWRHLIHDCCA